MDSSSRLRPYTDMNNAVKLTFQKGEKVEAIWSTDGQRYPGTIVQVYPNDNYEILFNDGVKSRKKANQIFKLKRRPSRFLPKNLPPLQVPVTSKPLPGLIPVKTVLGNPPSGAATPPHLNNNSSSKKDSDSKSSFTTSLSTPPPLSLEETSRSNSTLSSTKNDPSSSNNNISSNAVSIPDDPGGPCPVTPTSSDVASTGLCTRKGFVYVQQPHYSVFDIPPTDLGKRRRRVHNYSKLAKGPPLRGGIDGDIDGLADGELNSQPTSPASSVSTGRSSPVETGIGAPVSNRRKRSSTALTNNINSSVKKLTPNRTANSRTEEKVKDDLVVDNNSLPAQVVNSSNRIICGKSACDPGKSVPLTVSESQVNSFSLPNVKHVRTANVNNVEAQAEQPETESGIPSKRLRKPSSRFSADEGYMDVFSSRRTKITTQSPKQPTSPASPALLSNSTPPTSEITPKLQLQRPRSKHVLHNASKKTRELGPPVLFPETEQVDTALEQSNETSTSKEINNCDLPKTNFQSIGEVTGAKTVALINNINKTKKYGSSDEEELLDVGEYTVIEQLSSKKPSRASFSDSKSGRSGPPSPVIVPLNSQTSTVADRVPLINDNSEDTLPKILTSSTASSSSKHRVLRHRGRGRRWQIPSKTEKSLPEKLQPMPSVVLNRLPISKVHVMVEKCDSVLLASSSSTCLPNKEMITLDGHPEAEATQPVNSDILSSSSAGGRWRRKKRWGESKNRWTKSSQKAGGLLPGMRPGMRVKDSLSMQLIKRSRLQRRYEKRGRPRLALLTGITKKKLKRIQESIKKRKLKKTTIAAFTKYKDVRVDIINCICGRTDEFGLMIQCEVCLCWQHGVCFHIQDSSKLPKFYVCQSCRSPKCVRSSQTTEAIRQETYKKGVLPFYPFAPKPSTRKQRILKACDELTKVINSIDDSIRQNKIKEQIALAEPDHPKLYQWSTQRPIPKDQIQRWHFNKYFKSILRRLMSRHKKNPAYLDKLRHIVNFRDKLKKYSQAFEEARLAIRRKIGPRGLILIEKLSEQQCKIEKITKAKLHKDPLFRKQHVQIQQPVVIGQLQFPSLPPPSGRESEDKSSERKNVVGGADKGKSPANLAEKLERLTQRYGYLCDEASSVDSDDSDFEQNESDSDSEGKDADLPDSDSNNFTTMMESAEGGPLAVQKAGFANIENSSIIKLENCDIVCEAKKPEEDVVSKGLIIDSDVVGLVNGFVKGDVSWDSSRESTTGDPDFDSEGEQVLMEDRPDGEEYLLQPQTEIDKKYNKYRSFLLKDELVEYNEETDPLWTPLKSDVVRKDWLWDYDSEIGVEDVIVSEESDSGSEWEEDESSSDEFDADAEEQDGINGPNADSGLKYWEKALTSQEESENSEDENDTDWQVQEALEEISSSETDEDSVEDDSDISDINEYPVGRPIRNENSCVKSAEVKTTPGVILVTNDLDTTPGDVVEVVMKVGARDETISTGKVVAGGKGQNFIRLIDPVTAVPEIIQSPNNSTHTFNDGEEATKISNHCRIPLCKSCRESIGSKWTWDELDSAKGIEVCCEDTILSYIQELKKYLDLGLWSAKSNVEVDLNKPCGSLPKMEPCGSKSEVLESAFQPRQLKELCREAIKTSKTRTVKTALVQDGASVSSKPSRVNPPTSAEEESILSLLSLSKTPVQFNGENVSELSIESLRRLTDQLQFTNGPLSEGLAKAVGQPVNGKVNPQNCQHAVSNTKLTGGTKSVPPVREALCVRCSLKGKSSKMLTVLSTIDQELANTVSDVELPELHKELSEAVRKVRASAHVIKRAVFKKVSIMSERMTAERIARANGEKVIPISAQGKVALTKPEEYLHGLKSEYVDALLPYATYFISRFTKRDELNKAKKSWVQDMISKFIIVKKSLKEMYTTDNDESRVGKEDKFYTALDNLRKSFDIVLTKKDIKMRRQNQNSEAIAINHLGPNGIRADVKRTIDNSKSAVPTTLVNGCMPEEAETSIVSDNINVDTFPSSNPVSSYGYEKSESGSSSQLSELELLTRLSTYPIQVEDVNALLGITSKEIEKCGQECDTVVEKNNTAIGGSVKEKEPDSLNSNVIEIEKGQDGKLGSDLQLTNGPDDPMEVDLTDDTKLLEDNLELKTSDNLVIGGDMDLINAIGTFGGTEDSDLLLNVFNDPAFSEPQEEPKPCCSKSLTETQPPPPKQIAPVLMKLTPEMCRGYLVEDIRAHQHIIDVQLDRVESEIMELERRRGKGLKEKEDDKLFSRLTSNMQMLIYNMDVLDRVTQHSVGEDDNENLDSGSEEGGGEDEDIDQHEEEEVEEAEEIDEGGDQGDGGSTTETCPSPTASDIEHVDVDIDTSSSDTEDLLEI